MNDQKQHVRCAVVPVQYILCESAGNTYKTRASLRVLKKKKHSENAKFIIKPTRVFCAGSISSNCFENEHIFWKNTKRNLQWSIISITKQRIKQY